MLDNHTVARRNQISDRILKYALLILAHNHSMQIVQTLAQLRHTSRALRLAIARTLSGRISVSVAERIIWVIICHSKKMTVWIALMDWININASLCHIQVDLLYHSFNGYDYFLKLFHTLVAEPSTSLI